MSFSWFFIVALLYTACPALLTHRLFRYTTSQAVLPTNSADLADLEVGVSREAACGALLAKAESMLDSFGLLRKPSSDTVAM